MSSITRDGIISRPYDRHCRRDLVGFLRMKLSQTLAENHFEARCVAGLGGVLMSKVWRAQPQTQLPVAQAVGFWVEMAQAVGVWGWDHLERFAPPARNNACLLDHEERAPLATFRCRAGRAQLKWFAARNCFADRWRGVGYMLEGMRVRQTSTLNPEP